MVDIYLLNLEIAQQGILLLLAIGRLLDLEEAVT